VAADILLTHSNHLYSDRKQIRKMQPYPPLQTLIAAARLRECGYTVALLDVTLTASPEREFQTALETHRPRLVAVVEDNFNFLTKMCLLRNRELAFRMCSAARDAGIPAVVNGSDSADHATAYLAAGFEMVLTGEVESSLENVARQVVHGENLGLYGRVAPPAPLPELDFLPDAEWDLVDMEAYRAAWTAAHGSFSLNMTSSRGCPYRCNWCAKPVFGSGYRFRSPERVAQEMLRLKRHFGAQHIWFTDDIFALSAHWTLAFSRAVAEIGAEVPFRMQSRCDLMTRDTVGALGRAGCAEVWMGAESGSQKVLDAMDKGTRTAHIYEARENLRRHGIRACFFLQLGYPGETWQDIERTIRMVRETEPDDIGVSVAYPLPGTKFYERVAAQLEAKENWNDSDDLSMMFHGAYSSEFYRELAHALHEEVRGGDPHWDRVYELEKVSARPTLSWISC
jgi:anaerobic magnesium-protoporphyrin IX monomethyl ester cyclase